MSPMAASGLRKTAEARLGEGSFEVVGFLKMSAVEDTCTLHWASAGLRINNINNICSAFIDNCRVQQYDASVYDPVGRDRTCGREVTRDTGASWPQRARCRAAQHRAGQEPAQPLPVVFANMDHGCREWAIRSRQF